MNPFDNEIWNEVEDADDAYYDNLPRRQGPGVRQGVPPHVLKAVAEAEERNSADRAQARGFTDPDAMRHGQRPPVQQGGGGPAINRGGGGPNPFQGGNNKQPNQGGGRNNGGNGGGHNNNQNQGQGQGKGGQPPQGARNEKGDGKGFSLFGKGDNNAQAGNANRSNVPFNRGGGGGMPVHYDPRAGYVESMAHRVIYRGIAGASAILGYLFCSGMSTLTFHLAVHNLAVSAILGIISSMLLNAMQRVFRTSENVDAGVIAAGLFGYIGEYLLVLMGVLLAGNYELAALPVKTGTETLTWLQFVIVAAIAGAAVFLPEPVGEYVVNGKFYWMGRRLSGNSDRNRNGRGGNSGGKPGNR